MQLKRKSLVVMVVLVQIFVKKDVCEEEVNQKMDMEKEAN